MFGEHQSIGANVFGKPLEAQSIALKRRFYAFHQSV